MTACAVPYPGNYRDVQLCFHSTAANTKQDALSVQHQGHLKSEQVLTKETYCVCTNMVEAHSQYAFVYISPCTTKRKCRQLFSLCCRCSMVF